MDRQGQDPLQDWFLRQREERMAELQQISSRLSSHTDTGASASSNSAAVCHLLENRTRKSEAATSEASPPRQQPEMSQAILVEVRGLFETRPVTNMLHSPHFRRDLENIVRASVTAARNRPRTDSSSASSAISQPDPVPSAPTSSAAPTSRVDHPPRLPAALQPASEDLPPSAATLAFNLQREQLVVDISELLHTRLVSSTLRSGFRDTLEDLLQETRVNAAGGQRSVEALSRLPTSHRVRNDFSHLGIPLPAPGVDSDDAVSIISATAVAVPMSQTSVGAAREMASLKSEIQEMRGMLKTVFDMQSDLYRAVRQEVAAAMTMNNPATERPAPMTSRPTQSAGRCLICLSVKADTVTYRCGHLCMCNTCAMNLSQRQGGRQQTCPVCRAPVQDLMRVYVCDDEANR